MAVPAPHRIPLNCVFLTAGNVAEKSPVQITAPKAALYGVFKVVFLIIDPSRLVSSSSMRNGFGISRMDVCF